MTRGIGCYECGKPLTAIGHYRGMVDGVMQDFCGLKCALDLMEEPSMTAKDTQVGGNHYKSMKIQPIEFTLANGLGFCEGNVIKYVSRWKSKNGVEDLRKAKHYIEMLIESVLNEEKA